MTFSSLFQKEKNGHQLRTGWWHHLRFYHSHLNFISLKAKDGGHFISAYRYAAGLLSSMEQACENMIHKYIFLRDVRLCTGRATFDGSRLITPALSPSDSF